MSAEAKKAEGAPDEAKDKKKAKTRLAEPAISDTLEVLALAELCSKPLGFGNLNDALEQLKEILLPLVEFLDQEVQATPDIKHRLQDEGRESKERLLLLYPPRNADTLFVLAINRSGEWIVVREGRLERVTTLQLTDEFNQVRHRMIPQSIGGYATDFVMDKFLELGFGGIGEQSAIIHFLRSCSERIIALIEEREKRLQMMRKRVGILDMFASALDPIAASGEHLRLVQHGIVDEGGHGARMGPQGYFDLSALDPFWEIAKRRTDHDDYKPHIMTLEIEDMQRALRVIMGRIKGVEEAEDRNRSTADDLFGWTGGGQLDLNPAEIEYLRKVREQIESGEFVTEEPA